MKGCMCILSVSSSSSAHLCSPHLAACEAIGASDPHHRRDAAQQQGGQLCLWRLAGRPRLAATAAQVHMQVDESRHRKQSGGIEGRQAARGLERCCSAGGIGGGEERQNLASTDEDCSGGAFLLVGQAALVGADQASALDEQEACTPLLGLCECWGVSHDGV